MRAHDEEDAPPIWAAISDLMACLFGLFVLFFVWMVMTQVVLGRDLASERARLLQTRAKLTALESALAGPLASGLITLVDGRIGIRGAVLFETNKAELRAEGRVLIKELAAPLGTFLKQNEVALMISGFTDDKQLKTNGTFADNWELSAQRALTVTRTLIEAGLPGDSLIAAGFGEHHPIAPNDTDEQRAQNRRVEISAVPRPESFRARAARAQTPP
ncbi:MAG TPA: OmpA family protein [Polyangiales bacterium]